MADNYNDDEVIDQEEKKQEKILFSLPTDRRAKPDL